MSTRFHNWLIAVPALIFNTNEIFPARPVNIEGRIVHKTTGKSIENVYVYIVSGEEEALTGKDGVFKISTWQDLPVTLVIEHPQYKQQKIRISDSTKARLILLESK
ncbi:MAG: carboxypeptidase-like regulatory domain-containing protein [Chitinophagaceae bacterium]